MKKIIPFLLLCSHVAFSRPVTAPGIFVGMPMGKPFPLGWYLMDLPAYVDVPVNNNPSTNVFLNSTGLAYVAPYTVAKGQLEIYGSFNVGYFKSAEQPSWLGNLYNPDLMVGLAWDLGHHLYFSDFIGTYFPMNTPGLSTDQFVFNNRAALTYFNDKNEITAHVIYGVPGYNYSSIKPDLPQYVNLDLTLTHRFKELEIGPIAFGSWDCNTNDQWSQFAIGGLIGYDFGPFSLQGWIAKDTNANHWGGYALSGFLRLIIPFGQQKQALDTDLGI